MKAFISYPEIQEMVFSKTDKNVVLSYKDDKTVSMAHRLAIHVPLIGKVEKNIKVNITIEEISGTDIKLKYSMSIGMVLFFSGIRKLLGDIIEKSRLLSWGDEGKIIILHLDEVADKKNLHNFSQLIKYCTDISFKAEKDGVIISFNLQNL